MKGYDILGDDIWASLTQILGSIQFESMRLTYSTLCVYEELQDVSIKGYSHEMVKQWKQLKGSGNYFNIMHLSGPCEIRSIRTKKEATTLMGRTQEDWVKFVKVTISCYAIFISNFLPSLSIGCDVAGNGVVMVVLQRMSSMKFESMESEVSRNGFKLFSEPSSLLKKIIYGLLILKNFKGVQMLVKIFSNLTLLPINSTLDILMTITQVCHFGSCCIC